MQEATNAIVDKERFAEAKELVARELRTAALKAAFNLILPIGGGPEPEPMTFCMAVKLARAGLYAAALDLATEKVVAVRSLERLDGNSGGTTRQTVRSM